MRYVVYGAGAVGGTIAARLALSGFEVAAIARGAHLDALRGGGLRLTTPEGETVVRMPAHGSAADCGLREGDVVVLCVKGQDTAAALDDIAAAAPGPEAVAIACAQNGVDNERQTLRRLARVYGMLVYLPAQHLEPGVVQCFSAPVHGVLDVGRVPAGSDPLADQLATDLTTAGFASRAVGDVMSWKRAKLLRNLGNALDALLGQGSDAGDLEERAEAEARACFAAARLAVVPDDKARERMRSLSLFAAAGPRRRGGSSSWQSLVRGSGSIEADWLNGEVVLLGRLHGIPTPVNEALQMLANRAARERRGPGGLTPEDVRAAVGARRG